MAAALLTAKALDSLAVEELIKHLFTPPPVPPIELPWGAKIAGAMQAIEEACKMAYWAGVKDGLTWGVLITLFIVMIVILRVKGLGNVQVF